MLRTACCANAAAVDRQSYRRRRSKLMPTVLLLHIASVSEIPTGVHGLQLRRLVELLMPSFLENLPSRLGMQCFTPQFYILHQEVSTGISNNAAFFEEN